MSALNVNGTAIAVDQEGFLVKGTPAKLAAKLAGLPKPSNCI